MRTAICSHHGASSTLSVSPPSVQVFPTLSILDMHKLECPTGAMMVLRITIDSCLEGMTQLIRQVWPLMKIGHLDHDAVVKRTTSSAVGCLHGWRMSATTLSLYSSLPSWSSSRLENAEPCIPCMRDADAESALRDPGILIDGYIALLTVFLSDRHSIK